MKLRQAPLLLALLPCLAQAWGVPKPSIPSVPSVPVPSVPAPSVPVPSIPSVDPVAEAKKALDLFTGTAKTAAAAFDTSTKPVVSTIGKQVFDTSQSLGAQGATTPEGVIYPVVKGGKTVAQAVVKDGKIVATKTLDPDGKVTGTQAVKGAKLIVSNGKVTGREIVVGGKVVGEEVLDATGKVSANKVVDTGRYALNKGGEFVLNGLAPEVCSAAVKALSTRTKIDLPAVPGLPGLPKFEDQLAVLKTKTAGMSATLGNGTAKLQPFLDSLAASYAPAEMERLRKLATDNSAKVAQLFSNEQLICKGSKAELDNAIAALGLKTSPVRRTALLDLLPLGGTAHAQSAKRYFNTFTFGLSGANMGGLTLQLMLATDYAGQGGVYLSFGPMLVTNETAGASITLGFYPSLSVESFEGLGWSVSAAAGPTKKVASGALEFNIADNWSELQGFGVAAGVGVGLLPVDFTFAGTYTIKLR